jgi:predicted Zn-dependent protease
MKTLLRIVLLLSLASTSLVFGEDDVVMKAMRDELARSMEKLRAPDVDKPYFLVYRVNEDRIINISATLGDLVSSSQDLGRTLYLEVRVGDYKLDNSNFLSRSTMGMRAFSGSTRLPIDDDYDQIRRAIWLATDREYKQSAEELASKRSVLKTRSGSNDLPDYLPHEPLRLTEPRSNWKSGKAELESLARELSTIFRNSPELLNSSVRIQSRDLYVRYINSEGATFTRPDSIVSVHVEAAAQANDGQPLVEAFDSYSLSPDTLDKNDLLSRTKQLATRLRAMRDAKMLERYNGPVLFEGVAAAQAFAQVFAPGLVATRFPTSDEPQAEAGMQQFLAQLGGGSLADRLGGRVLPDSFDVVDKPREDQVNGVPLIGTTPVDDEAVPTRDFTVVEKGILKGLLATRTPTSDAKTTTGSRHGISATPTNLFLVSRTPVSDADLRKKLQEIAKMRGLEYGIVVRDLGPVGLSWVSRLGAMSMLSRTGMEGVGEMQIYKLYPDGREELVRGVEFAPFMVTNFKELLAAGDKPAVYTGPFLPMLSTMLAGIGGASAVGDPFTLASFVSPSLLFEEAGLKKVAGPSPNAPVVPSPVGEGKVVEGK